MSAAAGINLPLASGAPNAQPGSGERGVAAEGAFEQLLEALEVLASTALLPAPIAQQVAAVSNEAAPPAAQAVSLRALPLGLPDEAPAPAAQPGRAVELAAELDTQADEALLQPRPGLDALRSRASGVQDAKTPLQTAAAHPGVPAPVTPGASRPRPGGNPASRADAGALRRDLRLPQISAAASVGGGAPQEPVEASAAAARWVPWEAGNSRAADAETSQERLIGSQPSKPESGRRPAEGADAPQRALAPDAITSDSLNHSARVASERVAARVKGPAEVVVPERVAWLAARGGGSARVVLHPAELGEIEISVRVRGSRVDVAIRTEEAATRTALLELRDSLGESFAARELRVESLEVRVGEGRPVAGGDPQGQGGSAAGRDGTFANSNAHDGSGWGHARDERRTSQEAPPRAGYPAEPERTSDAPARLDLHV